MFCYNAGERIGGLGIKDSRGTRSSRDAKKGQGAMPLAESRGGASGGVWGNAPTTGRATIPKEAASKGCRQRSVPASNFALPQERPQLALPATRTLSRPLARPQRWSSRHSMTFPQAGISPLRRRQGAMETDEVRNRPPLTPSFSPIQLDFYWKSSDFRNPHF